MAAILAASIAALVVAVGWLVISQNTMAAQREQQVVGAAVDANVAFLRELNRDYSVWNDAVSHAVLRSDVRWLDDQISNYLFQQRAIEQTYILQSDGTAVYGRSRGQRAAPTAARLLGPGLSQALDDLVRQPRRTDEQIGGITKVGDRPAIFSLSRIRPDKPMPHAGGAPARYLLLIQTMNDTTAAKLAGAAQLPWLALFPTPAADFGQHRLVAYDGTTVGYLIWASQHPGWALLRTLAPLLAGFSAALLYLGVVVIRHARLSVRQLSISEAKAKYMAGHDTLTGLPNRRAFVAHLTQISISGTDYAIVYLDLDGFKDINDIYGHGTGDAVLRRTAERLHQTCPQDAFLARLGGDEFAMVLSRSCTTPELDALAQRLILAVRERHELSAQTIAIGVSIGIARKDGLEFEDVLRRADVAMYSAKGNGPDSWCIYDASLDATRAERRALEMELAEAIHTRQISLEFQPIVRAGNKQVSTLEALVRWDHPTRGRVSPDIFIPIAEESGIILELGLIVLRMACEAARDWPFKLAVNLSPAQFWDSALVSKVLGILRDTRFPASRLELEITETYLLRRPEAAKAVIEDLQSHGIRVALDDFGTGYASIGYLRRFNLDFVKLDRSFVDGIAQSNEAQDIASAIIALSRALKLPIVAEGVENLADADHLTDAGCHFLQGWLFGRPVPASVIDDGLIAKQRTA